MTECTSQTVSKLLLTVALTASSTSFNHNLGFLSSSEYLPLKNIQLKGVDNSIFNDFNEQSTYSTFWENENFSKENYRNINSDFELKNTTKEIIEISLSLFSSSQPLTNELSEILINTIERIGKKETTLPNRL